VIEHVRLVEKSGGRSGDFRAGDTLPPTGHE
jgi:molybdenum cofactor biosynthesis enzyme